MPTFLELARGRSGKYISPEQIALEHSGGRHQARSGLIFCSLGHDSTQAAEEIASAAQAFGQQDDITVLTLHYAPV